MATDIEYIRSLSERELGAAIGKEFSSDGSLSRATIYIQDCRWVEECLQARGLHLLYASCLEEIVRPQVDKAIEGLGASWKAWNTLYWLLLHAEPDDRCRAALLAVLRDKEQKRLVARRAAARWMPDDELNEEAKRLVESLKGAKGCCWSAEVGEFIKVTRFMEELEGDVTITCKLAKEDRPSGDWLVTVKGKVADPFDSRRRGRQFLTCLDALRYANQLMRRLLVPAVPLGKSRAVEVELDLLNAKGVLEEKLR